MKTFAKYLLLLLVLALFSRAETELIKVQKCDPSHKGRDCLSYPFQKCDTQTLTCKHKNVFPLKPTEIVMILCLPFLFAIAAVAGVGGGMIFLPLAIGLMHFTAKEAIPMCAVIVLQTALIRFIFFSARAKHPDKENATEIDYNMVKLVYPIFLIGSYIGVILNILLSELALVILLITVLAPLVL